MSFFTCFGYVSDDFGYVLNIMGAKYRYRSNYFLSYLEAIANQVKDTGDVYFVPAFSGLFTPHWQADARG